MARWLVAVLLAFGLLGRCGYSYAAEGQEGRAKEALALIQKAIQAVGGEEKLAKLTQFTYKISGSLTISGNDNPITGRMFIQGMSYSRQELETSFNNTPFKAVTVVAKDKGWRNFAGNRTDMDRNMVANELRNLYLTVLPMVLVPLKGNDYKRDTVPDVTLEGKQLAGVRITPPDGKDFLLFFDKETGLPAKMVANVVGFDRQEATEETLFGDYKEVDGIKRASHIEARRNGQKYLDQQIAEFQVPQTIDPKLFVDL